MKRLIINFGLVPVLLCLLSCANTEKKEPWIDLAGGSNLEGWTLKNGSAEFSISNGEITGRAVLNSPNSFLCTDKSFGDFILEFEVFDQGGFNSGVQIRSISDTSVMNGRVHGYQVEIDPSERAWSGGIYDEARRGWLYPLDLNPEARSAFRNGEWNSFRVEAIGHHISTWINGVAVANLWDEETSEGFIALQVHDIGNDSALAGTTIHWRNIRIITDNPANYQTAAAAPEFSRLRNQLTETEKEKGWQLLFDGSTTGGWRKAYGETFPEKGWIVEDGILTVLPSDGAEAQNGGDIVTTGEYAAFDLHLEFRITKGANSGIKYYVAENEVGNKLSAIGPEFQILDDLNHPDALLGNHEGSRTLASLYDLIKAENKKFYGIGVWNSARIVSDGSHVSHYLNGIKVLEYDRHSDAFRKLVSESKYKDWENFGEAPSGHILLQDHGNEVSFRSIKVLPL
ncbi:MAG: 3-keto-disaccharide hydrolase [Bacteroidota bacterium]